MTEPRRASSDRDRTTRWLLLGGLVGPVFFVAAFAIGGSLTSGYDPARMFVSDLALGALGWLQTAAFLITGVLVLGLAVGLDRVGTRLATRWPSSAVAVVGLGLVVAGVFREGIGHALGATMLFIGLPIACISFARRYAVQGRRGRAAGSLVNGFAVLILYIGALSPGAGAAGLADVAGWLQRGSLIAGLGWLAAMSIDMLRRSNAGAASVDVQAPGSPASQSMGSRR